MRFEDQLKDLGWNASVPPNGFVNRPKTMANNDNPLGLATTGTEIEIETTPEHLNLVAGDPDCASWTRAHDDPGVVALREKLRAHNGIKGLEVVAPHEVERAARLFHRDGFVAVRDALDPGLLDRLRDAAAAAIRQLLANDPDCSAGGGAGRMGVAADCAGGGSATLQPVHIAGVKAASASELHFEGEKLTGGLSSGVRPRRAYERTLPPKARSPRRGSSRAFH